MPQLHTSHHFMSLHTISPETQSKLAVQRRNTFISSCIIGFLFVLVFLLILSFVILLPLGRETPTIVTYQSDRPLQDELDVKKVNTAVQQKPSPPSSAAARVLAAASDSPIAVPVPEVEVVVPSLDFGDGDDFGDGWGSGDGFGGGGGATFFNQKVRADRIAYVIDLSQSMAGRRNALMREELTKSVAGLTAGVNYQLIFFAGPAWVAGNDVKMEGNRKGAQVTAGGRTFEWLCGGGSHAWSQKGAKQKPEWLLSSPATLETSLAQIKSTPLVWGTNWEPPLEMALAMDPPPQLIYFMTDGLTGGDPVALATKIAAKAKNRKVVINTLAMMEPKAEKAMFELAKRTGGQFTIIEGNGNVKEVKMD
jgi:hypothetical protein